MREDLLNKTRWNNYDKKRGGGGSKNFYRLRKHVEARKAEDRLTFIESTLTSMKDSLSNAS